MALAKSLNSLPNDKILAWSELKPFAEDRMYVTENLKFVLQRMENIVGGENAGHIFSFSNNVLKRLVFQGRLKSEL